MASFAKLNTDNIVVLVSAVDDDKLDVDGVTSESNGIAHLERHGAEVGFYWKQTETGLSPSRKNYAGIGYTFDSVRDAFIPPKPFPSWILNEATCQWDAPTAMPDDGKYYEWNEDTTSWDEY
jgi:hypothetical protein